MDGIQKNTYVPGFDWVKLFGSLLVAFSHLCLGGITERLLSPKMIALLGELIPVFFVIAGYLMYQSVTKKPKPYRYMLVYIMKYGSAFLLLSLVSIISAYVKAYLSVGQFAYKSFLVELVFLPFLRVYTKQLWFIPPLLLGIAVNVPAWLNGKERLLLWCLAPLALLVMALSICGHYLLSIPLIAGITQWEAFPCGAEFCMTATRGLSYVYLGILFAKHRCRVQKIRLLPVLLIASAITGLELLLLRVISSAEHSNYGMMLTVVIWSGILFLMILRIRGAGLSRFHSAITLFSGLTYFLHYFEEALLRPWLESPILIFVLACLLNAILTWGILCLGRIRKKSVRIAE